MSDGVLTPAGQALYGRIARITFLIPSQVAGNYTSTVATSLIITGEGNPTTPGLRITGKIARTEKKEPNTSELRIYNLSAATRGRLQLKKIRVTIELGYQGTGLSTYFVGDIAHVDHLRQGADWVTVCQLRDGDRGYRYARVNESFVGGTSASAVLQALVGATGLGAGNSATIAQAIASTKFQQGYTATGSAQRALDRFLTGFGYTWSIQNNAVQILLPGQSLQTQIPDIAPDSGLIGSPEMGTPEKPTQPALCKFKAMLLPVVPGAKVHLRSERYNTNVIVKKSEAEFDTSGGPWEVQIFGELTTS